MIGKLLSSIGGYFERRPQSRMYLVRLIMWGAAALSAGTFTGLDWTEALLLFLGVAGFDLGTVKNAESKTTPLDDPKLGAGQTIPPALYQAALAVAHLLPQPIDMIFKTLGVPGLELAVRTAEEALKRPLTPDEAKKALREGAAAQ